MSIRIGLYDFFSYTLPGVVYSLAVVYFLVTVQIIQIDINTLFLIAKDQIILLLIFSYLLGVIMDPLSKPWYRFFAPLGLEKLTLEEFRRRHTIRVKFEPIDWTILFAFIRNKNMELAGEIDKRNATKVMLRNISLGLLIISVTTIIVFFQTQFYLNLLLSVLLIVLSVIANREAAKFDRWFFLIIYQTVAAFNLEAADFTTLLTPGSLQSEGKQNVKNKKATS